MSNYKITRQEGNFRPKGINFEARTRLKKAFFYLIWKKARLECYFLPV